MDMAGFFAGRRRLSVLHVVSIQRRQLDLIHRHTHAAASASTTMIMAGGENSII
jgi:hypothetical protein